MATLHNILLVFAGFGILLFAFDMFSLNLSKLDSWRVTEWLKKHSNAFWKNGLTGFFLAALVGDSTPVLLMYAGLLRSGAITLPSAILAIIWANVGGGAILFTTFLDMELAVYALIGCCSILYLYKNRSPVTAVLLAAVLLLFGIQLMKIGFKGFETQLDLKPDESIFHLLRQSTLMLFLFGLITKLLTQSLFVLILFAISALNLNALSFGHIEILFGAASFGGCIGFFISGWWIKTEIRRLFFAQSLYEGARGCLFLMMALVEMRVKTPLLTHWMTSFHSNQLNLIVFLTAYLLLPAICLTFMLKWVAEWLANIRSEGSSPSPAP